MSDQQSSLFETEKEESHSLNSSQNQPLAYRLRPQNFDEFVGQKHLIGPGKPLRDLIDHDRLFSIILWGPPGCGKTSLARLISQVTASKFIELNAVTARIADIKDAIEKARTNVRWSKKTICFIDEIHRFNKTQQDALLPEVENGLITLIGATTENPFFSVIPSLISRLRVFELFKLEQPDLYDLYDRAVKVLSSKRQFTFSQDAKTYLFEQARGDARSLLTLLDMAVATLTDSQTEVTVQLMKALCQSKGISLSQDDHYDLISAYIKSMRGSDADAAIYWLARLLKGGEDPEFIARRCVIFASEDIGNADPQALVLATSLFQAVKVIGMPEIRINLAQVTAYLAKAPKSNTSYMAINKANQLLDEGVVYSVPNHLKDSHYSGAKKLEHGKGYHYSHNDLTQKQNFLPQKHSFYFD